MNKLLMGICLFVLLVGVLIVLWSVYQIYRYVGGEDDKGGHQKAAGES